MAGATAIGLVLASCDSLPNQSSPTDNASNEPNSETEVKISDSFASAARTSESAGDYLSAAGYWQSLLDRDPSDLEAAIGLADNLRRLDQYGYAINVLNSALSYHPDDPQLLSLLGRALVADGNAKAALDPLQRSVAMDPGRWETQAALAVAYGMLGELARSNEANMRALAASPDNPKVLNNMGLQAAMQGDLDGAIELLERASRGDEADSKIRLNLALLLAYRGDLDEAEALVREELSGEEAEQNVAFFRSLAGNDLQNLEELVARSNFEVDAQPLPPVGDGGTLASGQPTIADQSADTSTQIVEPIVEVVEPAVEVVEVAPSVEPSNDVDGGESAPDAVTMTYDDEAQELPATAAVEDSDDFVLPPETIVTKTTVEQVDTPPVEVTEVPPEIELEAVPEPEQAPDASDIEAASTSDDDLSILEMIGSITAPSPEAGADESGPNDARSNSRIDDFPADNDFDFEILGLSNDPDQSSDD